MNSLSATAMRAIEAYGGMLLWETAKKLEAEVSVTGLAFRLKRRPFFQHAKISMDIDRPISKLTPIGKDRFVSGLLNDQDAILEDQDGKQFAERKNARSFFPYGRRLLYWDDLDMAYFANYAFWNYFTLPKLLINPKITWKETKVGVLEALFPKEIPTHSRKQEFRFDPVSGNLIQHNYTAEIISGLASAAHMILSHKNINGFNVPNKRIVSPKAPNGKALGFPVLIEIHVHDFNVA
jgi:hypothetical protein